MKESIEDRIIAYFDGRLTDDESADLLHRVSVSPEIRKYFREHEALREIARTAQASAVVRPEVESDLFARIEAIAAREAASTHAVEAVAAESERKRRTIVPLFWTRWRIGLAAATGAFILGTAITLGPEWIGNDNIATTQRESTASRSQDQNTGSVTEQAPIASSDKFEVQQDFTSDPTSISAKQDLNTHTRSNRTYEDALAVSERSHAIDKTTLTENTFTSSSNQDNIAAVSSSASLSTLDQTISTVAIQSEPINLGGERGNAPVFRPSDLVRNDGDNVELSVESSTGFAYPASDPGVEPFADTRVSLGYFIDNNNIVGLRVTYGLFEVLPDATRIVNPAYSAIARDLETARLFNPGVYYTHREYSILGDYINLDATVGAGYITNGYTVSGELGLKFPLSSRINGGVSFALTRVHINAESMNDVMQNVTMESGPVLISGSDIRNTLNGRIQYGISYQF